MPSEINFILLTLHPVLYAAYEKSITAKKMSFFYYIMFNQFGQRTLLLRLAHNSFIKMDHDGFPSTVAPTTRALVAFVHSLCQQRIYNL